MPSGGQKGVGVVGIVGAVGIVVPWQFTPEQNNMVKIMNFKTFSILCFLVKFELGLDDSKP